MSLCITRKCFKPWNTVFNTYTWWSIYIHIYVYFNGFRGKSLKVWSHHTHTRSIYRENVLPKTKQPMRTTLKCGPLSKIYTNGQYIELKHKDIRATSKRNYQKKQFQHKQFESGAKMQENTFIVLYLGEISMFTHTNPSHWC